MPGAPRGIAMAAEMFGIRGLDQVVAARLLPLGTGGAEVGSRPHPHHVQAETEGQLDRPHGIDLENHANGAAVRAACREHALPDGEGGVRVGDGGHLRRDVDDGGEPIDVDRYRVVLHFRRDAELAEDLRRPQPGLERAVLLAQDRSVLAHHAERLLPLAGLRDGKHGRLDWKPGDGMERGLRRGAEEQNQAGSHGTGPFSTTMSRRWPRMLMFFRTIRVTEPGSIGVYVCARPFSPSRSPL